MKDLIKEAYRAEKVMNQALECENKKHSPKVKKQHKKTKYLLLPKIINPQPQFIVIAGLMALKNL